MTCAEAEELLPWVANATASGEERGLLYHHVAGCAACRGDLARALALQRALTAAHETLPQADPAAGARLAATLSPIPLAARTDAVALAAAAMRALGAPPALPDSLDLLQRMTRWRRSVSLVAPLLPQVAQAAVAT
jgi:hypothetical protein